MGLAWCRCEHLYRPVYLWASLMLLHWVVFCCCLNLGCTGSCCLWSSTSMKYTPTNSCRGEGLLQYYFSDGLKSCCHCVLHNESNTVSSPFSWPIQFFVRDHLKTYLHLHDAVQPILKTVDQVILSAWINWWHSAHAIETAWKTRSISIVRVMNIFPSNNCK